MTNNQRYFHLSKNEYETMWLMYKPDEDGRYRCWEPITEEFWNEFEKLERAQQELQAYRDIIKELIPVTEDLFKYAVGYGYAVDFQSYEYEQNIIDKAKKLIDTVTPTSNHEQS